jgi:hypothetical protein
MLQIVPRPLRDIVAGPYFSRNAVSAVMRGCEENQGMNAVIGILGGGHITLPPAKQMIRAMLRTGMVAAIALALIKTQGSLAVGAVLTGIISLPAFAIAGGSVLLYSGCAAVYSTLASGCLTTLGIGLAFAAGGFITLEMHDIYPIGIAESTMIEPMADAYAKPLSELFNS